MEYCILQVYVLICEHILFYIILETQACEQELLETIMSLNSNQDLPWEDETSYRRGQTGPCGPVVARQCRSNTAHVQHWPGGKTCSRPGCPPHKYPVPPTVWRAGHRHTRLTASPDQTDGSYEAPEKLEGRKSWPPGKWGDGFWSD